MTVGVLIVSKGRESLIDTLRSVVSETFRDDEIKVIMDGVDIPSFASKFPNVKFIREEKHGYYGHPLRSKYQCSFENSDYILNVDDDDVLNLGWRSMISLYHRRGGFDLILFNYIERKSKTNSVYTSGVIPPITGNVVFRNEPTFTKPVWGNFAGGDSERVAKMIRRGAVVSKSEFAIMIKG